MANRHLLAINKLEDFRNWLLKNGWQIEETKGKYEVLRARKSTEKLPLIVYKKDKDGLIHLSVSDWNTKYVYEFINDNKSNKQTDLQTQLDQQKAMWNELKEHISNQIIHYDELSDKFKEENNNGCVLLANSKRSMIEEILYKMQELEGEDEI